MQWTDRALLPSLQPPPIHQAAGIQSAAVLVNDDLLTPASVRAVAMQAATEASVVPDVAATVATAAAAAAAATVAAAAAAAHDSRSRSVDTGLRTTN